MKTFTSLLSLSLAIGLGLHGTFLTFNKTGNLLWKNSETNEPIVFDTSKLHRIVINHSQANQSISYKSAIHLTNGDIIPGIIQSADDTSLTLTTDHLGKITIPRDGIRTISATPFGGKLLYYGPLNQDGWKIIPFEKPDKPDKPAEKREKDTEKEATAPAEKSDDAPSKKSWHYIANAWYSGDEKNSYLARKNALPDQCSLSFNIAWRGNLYAEIILHADFAPPEYTGEDKTNLTTGRVGHAYILTLSSHSANLSSISFDELGKPKISRFNETRPNLGLSDKNKSKIEIRLDKANKAILIYTDGEYKGKWDLGDNYDGLGHALAFSPTRYNKSRFRISDLAISKWNGMKDSAQSMSTSKRDIILLNNGLDRFSGTFNNIQDGKVSFQGTFNNTLSIPLDEVQEIHLATEKQNIRPETEMDSNSKNVYFYIYPYGRITGVPSGIVKSKKSHIIQLKTQLFDALQLDTRYINLIDFSHQNSLLELWDDNF